MSGKVHGIKLEYASTGRAACKACKLKIEKDSLRIGQEALFQGEHTTTVWRHLDCFSLGRKYKDIDPLDIEGYYDLKKADKARVIDYFEGGGQKKSVVDHVIDAITNSEKKGKKQDKDSDEDNYDPKDDPDANEQKKNDRVTRTTRNQKKKKKINLFRRRKSADSSSDEEDDSTDSDDDNGENQETDNEASDSDEEREKIRNRNKKEVQAKKKLVQQKAKTKGKSKGSTKVSMGYTPEQLTKFKENLQLFENKTAEYLKALLGVNNQPKTGTKSELVIKCADGKLLGQIPLCSACGGGKLRFDFNTGIYKCPGYMDDDVFQNCGQKFSINEVVRQSWIDDII